MKYLNGLEVGVIGPQISSWILPRFFCCSTLILSYVGFKIIFPVAHTVQIKSFDLGEKKCCGQIMTNIIACDLSHHPYTWMTKWIMPYLECINIFKKSLYMQHVQWTLCMYSTTQPWVMKFYHMCLSYLFDLIKRETLLDFVCRLKRMQKKTKQKQVKICEL
jgi:hypothetical protein